MGYTDISKLTDFLHDRDDCRCTNVYARLHDPRLAVCPEMHLFLSVQLRPPPCLLAILGWRRACDMFGWWGAASPDECSSASAAT